VSASETVIAGRYRLVELVGSGGMGVVWRAWDERLQRTVAVKLLHSQPGLGPVEAQLANDRAMREARITARLHHPYAVPVFDVVEHEGHPCLVMQFLASQPLSAVLQERTVLEHDEVAAIGSQVASALAAAHRVGIMHRDVKPGNVLIDDEGTARISDFGISRALGDVTLTATGMVTGTPAYLAPETARGGEFTTASDVFSLGSTLYTATEGAPPFGADPNAIVLLHKVAAGRYTPPTRSGALTPVLLHMLSPDPADRPTMAEVARELADLDTAAEPPHAAATVVTPAVDATAVSTITPAPTAALPVQADVPAVPYQPPVHAQPDDAPRYAPAAPAVQHAPPQPPDRPTAMPPAQRGGGRRATWFALAAILLVGVALASFANLLSGSTSTRATPTASTGEASPRTSTSPTAATPTPTPVPPTSTAPSPSTSSPSPSTATSTKPASSTAPVAVTGEPTEEELVQAVSDYYSLLPGNVDAAWDRLTPDFQKSRQVRDRGTFDRFWGRFSAVTVTDVEADPPNRVQARITYIEEGVRKPERRSFELVEQDGVLKIDGSRIE